MTRHLCIALALASVVSVTACGKKKDTEKLAKLCVQAGDQLARDASTASPDTFQLMLSNALEACSLACDGDDTASCGALDKHLTKVCKVMGDACDKLCETAHSPSLKDTACKLAKKK